MKLVIATRNKHKLEEICTLFDFPALEVISSFDFPDIPDIEEDGDTFEANAVKKARTIAEKTGHWALADDSGLEVDALGGAPGVYSARFAGEPVDYEANNEKLMKDMRGQSVRTARFRCVMALASPGGRAQVVEGICEGTIRDTLRGEGGFGYDPLFIPTGSEQTFAELSAGEKNRLSHRGRAQRKAVEKWGDVLVALPEEWPES